MRRTSTAAALGVAAVAVVLAGTPAAADSTKIVVEGEDYYSIKPSMEKAADEHASDEAYIHIPRRKRPLPVDQMGPVDDGNACFKLEIPVSGTYRLWGLCNWHLWDGNSFLVIVDGEPPKVFGQDGTYQRWHWVRGNRYELSKGEHTIRFQNREDGAKLDQFLLTTNMRWAPRRAEKRTPQYIVTAE